MKLHKGVEGLLGPLLPFGLAALRFRCGLQGFPGIWLLRARVSFWDGFGSRDSGLRASWLRFPIR